MSVIDEIKARLDIVQLITSYNVPLKRAGRSYAAPCPFHQEKTPSFIVSPDRQTWRCFGACGEGGDIFSFVMKREGVDFVTALRMLADRAGVQLQERTDEDTRRDERLDKLRGLLNEMARFYNELLSKTRFAREYARKRGLSDATLKTFQIGYAPDEWSRALDYLTKLGYTTDDVLDAGIATRNEAGRVYDRFRNRLMIPICDERGRVIGFGARALDPDDNPKYLNSPQTELFDKSATLFGLDKARRAIREGEMAVIVEGYMDAIQAHQAGFTNVVAQMGTALTKTQLKTLSKYARRLILALDPDTAGAKATMRGLEVVREASEQSHGFIESGRMMSEASKLDIEIMVMTLPEGQDPDDLIRDNPEGWQALVKSAQPVADYVISVGTARLSPYATPAEREQVARELLPILIATENELHRQSNIQQLAYKLRFDTRTLVNWAQQYIRKPIRPERARKQESASQPETQQEQAAPAQPTKQPRPEGAATEHHCLAILLRYPDLLAVVNRKLRELAAVAPRGQLALGPLAAEDFAQPECRIIFDTFERGLSQFEQELHEFIDARLPAEMRSLFERLRAEPLSAFEERLSAPLRIELGGVLRARQEKVRAEPLDDLSEALERGVLLLRKLRLKRQNSELQILQQDLESEASVEYGQQLIENVTAISYLERAVRHRQST